MHVVRARCGPLITSKQCNAAAGASAGASCSSASSDLEQEDDKASASSDQPGARYNYTSIQ